MPRIKALQHEYKDKDLQSYLRAWMYRANMTQEAVAHELGISRQAYNYKLRHSTFTYKDLLIIFRALQLTDDEILFLMVLDSKIGSRPA